MKPVFNYFKLLTKSVNRSIQSEYKANRSLFSVMLNAFSSLVVNINIHIVLHKVC